MAKPRLGRGLSALIGEEAPKGNITELDIDQIQPNSDQPRTRFTDTTLDELARSIAANGIVQPVVVRPFGTNYQIIAGERRWRAAQRVGLRRIPVVVREAADNKLLELALIENIQRQELNPVEEALAYRKLVDNIGLTQEQISESVGKERSLIATSMRLLKLPTEVLKLIEEEKLSASHGRALLTTNDQDTQKRIAKLTIEMNLSVREVEKMLRRASAQKPLNTENKSLTKQRDANVIAAETKMRRKLSTNVAILPSRNGKGGKIEIEYYSLDDLDRIYDLIIKER